MNRIGASFSTRPIWDSTRSSVARILKLGESLRELDDAELRRRSLALKYRVCSGVPAGALLPEAFALVREAAGRFLDMRHYDVQLVAGIRLHHGGVAVMQTGEGKTLTATLPVYLAALAGKGAHLATANDYLAERDATMMGPIYRGLGLSVGFITSESGPEDRRNAWAADITYTTAKEIGFDFLRDRMARRSQEADGARRWMLSLVDEDAAVRHGTGMLQRPFHFALIDEADSILIDEARTPLIISSAPDDLALAQIALYRWCAAHADQLSSDTDFEEDPKTRQITLTPVGRRHVRRLPKPAELDQTPMIDIYEQMELAIHVSRHYQKDRQYVVRDGEIVIVDEFTGRLAEGRQWRAGIHQAIQAREGVEISVPTGESARITVQDLFLMYDRLAGMTGTAANAENEFRTIYRTSVYHIPTHRPPRRTQWPDTVLGTEAAKWEAIAAEIASVHKTGRPILVGTRSIDKSERLSRRLHELGIKHEVLNARHLAREAEIIANAGKVNRVTVATNMAGRGTDIQLPEAAKLLGGMHVIVTELHESERIDRQLIGRCGRQGDPGSYRKFMSLEDEILRNAYGEARVARLRRFSDAPAERLIRFSRLFRRAQRLIERRHYQSRKQLLYREKLRREIQQEMGQDPYLDVAGAA